MFASSLPSTLPDRKKKTLDRCLMGVDVLDEHRLTGIQKTTLDRCLMGGDVLDEHLLTEILRRLPLKTVHQCKSVCKGWLSLISSPYFMKQYVGFHRSVTLMSSRYSLAFDLREALYSSNRLRISGCASSSFRSLKFFFDFYPKPEYGSLSYFDLVGSCNGLVLCRQLFRDAFIDDKEPKQHYYHVCNPVTRDHWILPPPPLLSYSEATAHDHVAFIDDGVEGEDDDFSVTRGFKVVQLDGKCRGGTLNMSIFSTSTGEWRPLKVLCKEPFNFLYDHVVVVCCNRMLYWVGWLSNFVIGYDPYTMPNECTYIKFPSQYVPKKHRGTTIGANQGRILLCDYDLRYPQEVLRIWELEPETESWYLKHQVELNSVPMLPDRATYRILAFHPFIDGDIVYLEEAIDRIDRILSLDVKNKRIQVITVSLLENDVSCHAFPFFLPWWQTRLSDLKNLNEANSVNQSINAQGL
ncbi:hypothetical protein Tsubulata_043205 [Turnera subulata]|uniref:F-box domain-containing protein n=1 Tax=Turnera subulata TaxID=218843 RepID=A0A9Q0F592_9ROSI|nr:hypothetical protein Tsubulata_043205 [Turnera subulata]